VGHGDRDKNDKRHARIRAAAWPACPHLPACLPACRAPACLRALPAGYYLPHAARACTAFHAVPLPPFLPAWRLAAVGWLVARRAWWVSGSSLGSILSVHSALPLLRGWRATGAFNELLRRRRRIDGRSCHAAPPPRAPLSSAAGGACRRSTTTGYGTKRRTLPLHHARHLPIPHLRARCAPAGVAKQHSAACQPEAIPRTGLPRQVSAQSPSLYLPAVATV